jgi:hypothetical protein
LQDRVFFPSQDKSRAELERAPVFEIFQIQESRRRFESLDNLSIIIANDFRQFMDDYRAEQFSQGDPGELGRNARRRKCSIIDGESAVLFPVLDRRRRGKDFQIGPDEIELELPLDQDVQIEFTFFDQNFGAEETKRA